MCNTTKKQVYSYAFHNIQDSSDKNNLSWYSTCPVEDKRVEEGRTFSAKSEVCDHRRTPYLKLGLLLWIHAGACRGCGYLLDGKGIFIQVPIWRYHEIPGWNSRRTKQNQQHRIQCGR